MPREPGLCRGAGGAVLTQPDGRGGQKTEPRRFEVLGEVAGARLSVREDT